MSEFHRPGDKKKNDQNRNATHSDDGLCTSSPSPHPHHLLTITPHPPHTPQPHLTPSSSPHPHPPRTLILTSNPHPHPHPTPFTHIPRTHTVSPSPAPQKRTSSRSDLSAPSSSRLPHRSPSGLSPARAQLPRFWRLTSMLPPASPSTRCSF